MPNGISNALILPLAVVGGWAAGAFTARYLVRREIDELRALINGSRVPAPQPAEAPVQATVPPPAAVVEAPPQPAPVEAAPEEEEISAETLSILAAAVAAYLGKRARVRGARLLRTGSQASPWAQQGRVYVQASHALPR